MHIFVAFCTFVTTANLQNICKHTAMIITKFYLDTRAAKNGQPAPLKLAITKNGKTALFHLNVSLLSNQWDKKAGKVVSHPSRQFLNTYINRRKIEIDTEILNLISSGEAARMNATEIKNRATGLDKDETDANSLFIRHFEKFAGAKKESTKGVYVQTLRRIKAFCENAEQLKFDDITRNWLTEFETFLAKTAPSKNARNIHLRNIRAVFNDAIDNELTAC